MRRIINKVKELRQHQYFRLYAAIGLLILAFTAYLTVFNRSYLIVIIGRPNTKVLIDGREREAKVEGSRYTFYLSPGIHTVRLTSPDTVDFAQTVSLLRGFRKTLNPALNLIPKTANKFSGDVRFLTPTKDQDNVLYLGDGGATIYRHNLKTNERVALTKKSLSGITNMRWSPDLSLVLLKRASGIYLFDFGLYNFVSQEEVYLGSTEEMSLPTWDPLGDDLCPGSAYPCLPDPNNLDWRLAYSQQKDEEKSLILANQVNEKQERVADLSAFARSSLEWSSDGQKIAILPKSSAGDLAIFDLETRKIKTLLEDKMITGLKWSPDGQRVIFTVLENNQDWLYKADLASGQSKRIELKTNIDRLTWTKDSNFLTLALPSESGQDKFVRYDIRSGEQINYVYTATDPIKVSRLIVNSDEASIIFQSNDRLYTLILQTEN